MSLSPFNFTKDWTNPSDFPPVASDAATARTAIQLLHNETKAEINTIISEVNNNKQNKITVNGVVKGDGSGGLSPATPGQDFAAADSTLVHLVSGVLKTLSGQSIAMGARLSVGTYTGTGTYGASNPNTLSFDFNPALVIVANDRGILYDPLSIEVNKMLFIRGETKCVIRVYSSGSIESPLTWSSSGVSWYNTAGAGAQFNQSGDTYYYFAIGE